MNTLNDLWKARKTPDANAIIHSSQAVTVMSSEQFTLDEAPPIVIIEPIADSTLASLLHYRGPDGLAPLTTLFTTKNGERWLECGESSDGRAGWFAVGRLEHPPDWVAFFQASNPFIHGTLHEEGAAVENSHGQRWHVPFASPAQLAAP